MCYIDVNKKETIVTFRTIKDLCNELFEANYERFSRGAIQTPFFFKDTENEAYSIWFPKIGEGKEWKNVLLENNTVIHEYDLCGKALDKYYVKNRVVFAKFKSGYKFIGIFKPENDDELLKSNIRKFVLDSPKCQVKNNPKNSTCDHNN